MNHLRFGRLSDSDSMKDLNLGVQDVDGIAIEATAEEVAA